jgi:hypothetical protein
MYYVLGFCVPVPQTLLYIKSIITKNQHVKNADDKYGQVHKKHKKHHR